MGRRGEASERTESDEKTAQLERGGGAVITSSGRKWGTSGTEAVSAYKAFKPNAADNGWGHAKTYYGK
ncbi:hypothetical protein GCM10025867_11190 [Frondihabitans sucicola]|uniref:Uncharacterized protein n=1 Tax=Frondihabitans sucicola TaxID=1268041 RepID=A0ABN6XZP0_9MICO|nr:hypothetical protein GCM10025867_11190 [Frondihabitans sucicola]